jgi:TolA-binding protein
MSSRKDLPEDLSGRARRGELSIAEQRRLRVYLESSDMGRELHEVGSACDSVPETLPGDAQLLGRVANRVLSQTTAPRAQAAGVLQRWRVRFRRPRHLPPVVPIVLCLLLTSIAGASVYSIGEGRDWSWGSVWPTLTSTQVPQTATTARSSGVSPGKAHAHEPAGGAARHERSDLGPPPEMGAPEHSGVALNPQPEASSKIVERRFRGAASPQQRRASALKKRAESAAASLFSQANMQRKSGDHSRALTSYQELQQRFPRSPEAQLSHLISARLWAARSRPQQAAAAFDRYLDAAPNGALVAEALHGKAQALDQSGNSAAARLVWQALLDRFPDSAFAATARVRLAR